jgi:hypothetical protein
MNYLMAFYYITSADLPWFATVYRCRRITQSAPATALFPPGQPRARRCPISLPDTSLGSGLRPVSSIGPISLLWLSLA